MRPSALPSSAELLERLAHGVRARYVAGCRCAECTAAAAAYECARRQRQREQGWNGMVSTARARRHLQRLSARGIGARAVHDACDVPLRTLQLVARGQRAHLRALTEHAILACDHGAAADNAIVDAAEMWRQIAWLRQEGFTVRAIALRLGYGHGRLNLGRERVRARSALAVRRLYASMQE